MRVTVGMAASLKLVREKINECEISSFEDTPLPHRAKATLSIINPVPTPNLIEVTIDHQTPVPIENKSKRVIKLLKIKKIN